MFQLHFNALRLFDLKLSASPSPLTRGGENGDPLNVSSCTIGVMGQKPDGHLARWDFPSSRSLLSKVSFCVVSPS